uniref:Ovule protein n=1 Tax=Romanomermis culicivorax TaxID=13658 RepID=A0A915HIW5_ROMCU
MSYIRAIKFKLYVLNFRKSHEHQTFVFFSLTAFEEILQQTILKKSWGSQLNFSRSQPGVSRVSMEGFTPHPMCTNG